MRSLALRAAGALCCLIAMLAGVGAHAAELKRPELTQRIHFGGRTQFAQDAAGRLRARWVDSHDVLAVPYDVPIPGYRNGVVNTLRLWSATATDEFDLGEFNAGSYTRAVAAKYDDVLLIETTLDTQIKGGVKFDYKIFNQNGHTLIAKGYTKHACLNGDGKVVRPPGFIRKAINKIGKTS